ncbi:MAG: hypothetical protein MUF16_22635 [Burkholderiaceae bacterium]|jgi:hypothetical protein|nr:hypothetical protein [Burkholderiaceae bacterium]
MLVPIGPVRIAKPRPDARQAKDSVPLAEAAQLGRIEAPSGTHSRSRPAQKATRWRQARDDDGGIRMPRAHNPLPGATTSASAP